MTSYVCLVAIAGDLRQLVYSSATGAAKDERQRGGRQC